MFRQVHEWAVSCNSLARVEFRRLLRQLLAPLFASPQPPRHRRLSLQQLDVRAMLTGDFLITAQDPSYLEGDVAYFDVTRNGPEFPAAEVTVEAIGGPINVGHTVQFAQGESMVVVGVPTPENTTPDDDYELELSITAIDGQATAGSSDTTLIVDDDGGSGGGSGGGGGGGGSSGGGGGGSGGGSGGGGGGENQPPVFENGLEFYSVVLGRHKQAGDALKDNGGRTVARATDPDNDAITYSLAGADNSLFTIDSATGSVTLLVNALALTQPSYQFTVIANDGQLSTSAAVEITVADAVGVTGDVHGVESRVDDITVTFVRYSLSPATTSLTAYYEFDWLSELNAPTDVDTVPIFL
jgi:hypothetical protein